MNETPENINAEPDQALLEALGSLWDVVREIKRSHDGLLTSKKELEQKFTNAERSLHSRESSLIALRVKKEELETGLEEAHNKIRDFEQKLQGKDKIISELGNKSREFDKLREEAEALKNTNAEKLALVNKNAELISIIKKKDSLLADYEAKFNELDSEIKKLSTIEKDYNLAQKEQTRKNFELLKKDDRINELKNKISELESRIITLKKESGKGTGELSAELLNNEKEFRLKLSELAEENKARARRITELEEELKTARDQYNDKETAIRGLKDRISELENSLKNLIDIKGRNASLAREKELADRKIKELELKIEKYEAINSANEMALTKIEEKNHKLTEALQKAGEEELKFRSENEAQLAAIRKEFDAKEGELNQLRSLVKELSEKADDAKKEIESEQVRELRGILSEQRETIASLQEFKELFYKQSEELDRLTENHMADLNLLEEYRRENHRLKAKSQELEAQIISFSKNDSDRKNGAENEMNRLKDRINNLENELDNLNGQITIRDLKVNNLLTKSESLEKLLITRYEQIKILEDQINKYNSEKKENNNKKKELIEKIDSYISILDKSG
ncbi:MAG: hypothetical protein ACLFR2_09120 [Candidatus Kapaibacterium sp.]